VKKWKVNMRLKRKDVYDWWKMRRRRFLKREKKRKKQQT
jgi:hypothetical protein